MGHSEHDPAEYDPAARERRAWNAGRIVGAKRALKPSQVWAIRFWLGHERRPRDRALFDLAIDGKPRGSDVVKIRIGDIVSGGQVRTRAIFCSAIPRSRARSGISALMSRMPSIWLKARTCRRQGDSVLKRPEKMG